MWVSVRISLNFSDMGLSEATPSKCWCGSWPCPQAPVICAASLWEVSTSKAAGRKCLGLSCCSLKPSVLSSSTGGIKCIHFTKVRFGNNRFGKLQSRTSSCVWLWLEPPQPHLPFTDSCDSINVRRIKAREALLALWMSNKHRCLLLTK